MTIKKIAGIAVLVPALLMASPALAQTTTKSTSTDMWTGATTGTTTTPGVPNTGAGGDAAVTLLILASAALLVIAGAAYLRQRLADDRGERVEG